MENKNRNSANHEYHDEEWANNLILLARQGDQVAFSTLCSKYMGMIQTMVGSFCLVIPSNIYSREDLHQDALMAFYRAVESYDICSSGEVTFGLYAKTCVRNALISLQRKSVTILKRQKAMAAKSDRKSNRDILALIVQSDKQFENTSRQLEATADSIFSMLTEFEGEVLKLFAEKMSYAQIAERLSCSTKAVDNALYRIRKKLKKRQNKK